MAKAKKAVSNKKTTTAKKVTKKKMEVMQEEPQMESAVLIEAPKNNSSKKTAFIAILCVLIVAIIFSFRTIAGWFVVATVNGQFISRMEFQKALEAQAGKQIMSSIVGQTLIDQEAQKKHITVSQKEIDAAVKDVKDSVTKQGGNFDQILASQGTTYTEFLGKIKTQKIVEKILASKITVTDKEVADYIDKNKDSLPQDTKMDDLQKQVKQQLSQQKLAQEFQTWIANVRASAKINYLISL